MNKEATILSVKNQDERVIQEIYRVFRPKFENWLKGRFKIGSEEDRREIYQRSFTVLYFNIKRGKLNDLEASLETYLFGVGKMVMKEWWREKKTMTKDDQVEITEDVKEVETFSHLFQTDTVDYTLRQRLLTALKELGEPCSTILKLYYWDRNSMEAIAIKTGYKNEKGAKKKKYLCLNKLRELMEK